MTCAFWSVGTGDKYSNTAIATRDAGHALLQFPDMHPLSFIRAWPHRRTAYTTSRLNPLEEASYCMYV